MREFHFRYCSSLLIVLSVATLPINAAEPGPAIKLPNGVSSPDGKKIVAPLDSRFQSVQVDLESVERKEWPNAFVDGAFSSDNQFVLTKNGSLIDAKTRQRVRAFNGGPRANQLRQIQSRFPIRRHRIRGSNRSHLGLPNRS